ncbi:MAG TPA: HEAT repeat domain-containing protein [Vicinamibacterales bacterium]|nr:HEAT repeat domain-containing protein [Vicinamibacterales bacterium]
MTSRLTSSIVCALQVPGAAAAQAPRVVNGQVAARAAGSSLEQTFHAIVSTQTDPAWIGYEVPVVDGNRRVCCGSGDGVWISDDGCGESGIGRVRLRDGDSNRTAAPATRVGGEAVPVRLEGSDQLLVLFRVEHREVERIRVLSGDCTLDAGGRTIYWLEGVPPAQSVAWLDTFVDRNATNRSRLTSSAVDAIALHRDDSAERALEQMIQPASPAFLARKAAFWLATTRGHAGFVTVERLARTSANDDVRKGAIFALSQSPDAGATPALLDLGRSDASPKVRGEAIFWLAQKAGRKVAAAITERIEQDPDTAVKKRAVFALSQLPPDEGVPLLIQVARTNRNPEVRRQAMFWLGQSRDPRALTFFAEILK